MWHVLRGNSMMGNSAVHLSYLNSIMYTVLLFLPVISKLFPVGKRPFGMNTKRLYTRI